MLILNPKHLNPIGKLRIDNSLKQKCLKIITTKICRNISVDAMYFYLKGNLLFRIFYLSDWYLLFIPVSFWKDENFEEFHEIFPSFPSSSSKLLSFSFPHLFIRRNGTGRSKSTAQRWNNHRIRFRSRHCFGRFIRIPHSALDLDSIHHFDSRHLLCVLLVVSETKVCARNWFHVSFSLIDQSLTNSWCYNDCQTLQYPHT